ncbi:uncharacterized protein LOC121374559 [Gigantopelta aegis]|uniref:uncharacterized protein LOC121374559 n=1 Tax=Gigantopelta aegis TaxID=1735272 RepID=UPI001B88E091|nr:uncharacterized protein LOC121374559 [Gigantopelta aegis]
MTAHKLVLQKRMVPGVQTIVHLVIVREIRLVIIQMGHVTTVVSLDGLESIVQYVSQGSTVLLVTRHVMTDIVLLQQIIHALHIQGSVQKDVNQDGKEMTAHKLVLQKRMDPGVQTIVHLVIVREILLVIKQVGHVTPVVNLDGLESIAQYVSQGSTDLLVTSHAMTEIVLLQQIIHALQIQGSVQKDVNQDGKEMTAHKLVLQKRMDPGVQAIVHLVIVREILLVIKQVGHVRPVVNLDGLESIAQYVSHGSTVLLVTRHVMTESVLLQNIVHALQIQGGVQKDVNQDGKGMTAHKYVSHGSTVLLVTRDVMTESVLLQKIVHALQIQGGVQKDVNQDGKGMTAHKYVSHGSTVLLVTRDVMTESVLLQKIVHALQIQGGVQKDVNQDGKGMTAHKYVSHGSTVLLVTRDVMTESVLLQKIVHALQIQGGVQKDVNQDGKGMTAHKCFKP